MISIKSPKNRLVKAIFGCFFGILGLILPFFASNASVYADPIPADANTTVVTDNDADTNTNTNINANTNNDNGEKKETRTCDASLGSLGWLVCPTTGKISEAVDWLYAKNKDMLEINPVKAEQESPIYQIWNYFLGVANLLFVIFLMVVVWSQITGVGINNYGVKKALPKLIIAAIMVNLSFLVCSLAVDLSNVIGNGLRGVFTSIEEATIPMMLSEEGYATPESGVAMTELYGALAGGTGLLTTVGFIAFEGGEIWMLIPAVLGALVSVVVGLITIALRQVVVILLIMIAPLAIVAVILPNTENLFKKWKDLLVKMLVFYPMYSLLFGASSLAGWAIIASANDGFGLILGTAVKIFPLFFSWSLMKMSGTFLGTVNAKITSMLSRPLAGVGSWAEMRKSETNAYYMQYGKTPYSHLRRYLNNRKELHEQNTANLISIRKNEANIYAQRKIGAGHDGTKSTGNSADLKPNKYTRAAKDASTSKLRSETATMDTAHALNNYDDYYVDRKVRDNIKSAERANNKEEADRIRKSDAESRRAAAAGQAYLEYSRAQMTAENDSEADFNFMVRQYLAASTGLKKDEFGNVPEDAMRKYRHYIVSSAGGLGEVGQTRVLGKIIAKAAAVESNQRRDIKIVAEKFPPDKRNFRNFLFNYFIDDDGYATDKEGNRIESMRDYLRVNDPDKLVKWDQIDPEYGPYFDWYDVNGNYVTRIYKSDKSAIKELMSNFDAPINDPINNMLAIHAGISEQKNSPHEVLRNMGLDAFRTTVGRALMNAPFKEKNAMFSPMVAEMVKKGYIKNYAHLYLAYLDSFNKATKPGAFNQMDADAVEMFANMMDPANWEKMFPTDLIRDRLNVNGEEIYGIRVNGNGETVKVPASEATRDELMARIKEKFIIPAAQKATIMMSRQTQNTMDNQKPGTIKAWKHVKDVLDTKWGVGNQIPVNPYKQDGNMRAITRDIRDKIDAANGATANNNRTATNGGATIRGATANANAARQHQNHAAQVYSIYNSSLDADEYAVRVSEYFAQYPETSWAADAIQDFIINEGYGVSKEQINDFVETDILPYIDID